MVWERKIVVFTTSITCCWLPQWFGLESAHLFMSIDIDCWYITWLVDVLFESISLSIGLFVLDCFFIRVNHCVRPICFFKLSFNLPITHSYSHAQTSFKHEFFGTSSFQQQNNVAASKGFGFQSFWKMGALCLLLQGPYVCLWGMYHFT